MATDVEKLMVRLEVSQRKFEKQLAQASRSADKNATRMERRFRQANRQISRSFDSLGRSAGNTFRLVSRLAIAAGAALGAREITRYADAWTEVENKIRAAEKISGMTARTTSELNDLANESRASLEETADLYAKLIRVSGNLGASEEEIAQATETVAKAFKAGGAAASEQAAGILQLSQALSSGFLQGDELRSLRENAPLVAQAIANEFETTIGGLKDLGAEGELTADRVFRAILNAQGDIEAAFASTVPTVADGFTALKNGATEFFGALSQGSGAGENFASFLANVGDFLSSNADKAARFGAQIAEAFAIIGEAFEGISGKIDFSDIVSGAGETAIGTVQIFSDLAQAVVATVSGVAAAAKQAFINAIAATGEGGIAIANAAIGVIESILQGILNGVQLVLDGINSVIATANKLPGVELPTFGELGDVSLGRIDPTEIQDRVKPIGDAFSEAANDAASAWEGWENKVISSIRRVERAGDAMDEDRLMSQRVLPPSAAPGSATMAPASPDDSSSNGKGGKGSATSPFFEAIQKEITALEDKMATLGMTAAEMAEYTAKQNLLNEAKKRGLDLDAVNAKTGQTLRDEIARQAETVGNLTQKYEAAAERAQFFDDIQTQLKDGIIDAIVEGENLGGVLEDLAKSIAKAALQAALFGEGPLAGMFGGSEGGILGSLFSNIFGGNKATGGGVKGGMAYQVGEHGRELFVPNTDGQIVNASDVRRLSQSNSGGQQQLVVNIHENAAKGEHQVRQSPGRIDVFLREAVAEQIRGGGADKAMSQRFGLRPRAQGA